MSVATPLGALAVKPLPNSRPPTLSLIEAKQRAAAESCARGYVQAPLASLDFDPPAGLDDEGSRFTERSELPDPHEWAARVGQAIIESMAGLRPAAQLARWVLPDTHAAIVRASLTAQRRRAIGGSPPRRLSVRRVSVCEPADGVAEAAIVIQDGARIRAMALRLIGRDGHWRVQALQMA